MGGLERFALCYTACNRMLRYLHIENYALIDTLDIEFRPGFNLLTGETGSGKSIVVDTVGLLLGEKAAPETIRSGASRAQVSGIFSSGPSPQAEASGTRWNRLRRLLVERGIEWPEGEDLILQRDILPAGKSRAFINSQPATVSLLKELAPHLAEVHGQNEQQELLFAGTQLEMLDLFGRLAALASAVESHFERWKVLRTEQETLLRRQQELLRQMDLWNFQKREIEDAGIAPGEDQRLEEEKRILVHAARIQASLAAAYDRLYDASESAVASVASAQRNLEEVCSYDASLGPLVETLLSAKVSIEDVALSLREYLSRLEASPGRLEEVENRRALLDRLKRKYGPALDDVLRYGEQVAAQLREAESSEERGQQLEEQVREAAAAYAQAAQELSRGRRDTASELKQVVEKELRSLAMKGTVFEAQLTTSESPADWRATGWDRVEFLISPNPGEPLKPLSRIASGGEISRIMLALETAVDARRGPASDDHTLIFDEVDSGIGGRAAETVGRKLRQLGERRQVLCVTHLPQIACFGHHQFRIEKTQSNGRTVTRVHYLSRAERTQELARMLSGSHITDAVMKHAAELLNANS